MVIEEKDFKLTTTNEFTPRFDLELLYKVSPKGKESRYEFKNVAYGITLEHAIKLISQYHISNNHKEESIFLLDYYKEFKEELNKLKELLCGV